MRSLPVRRIAVTTPPSGWFHGIPSETAKIYRQALLDLGLSVFDVPVEAFFAPDMGRVLELVDDLRRFDPELAIGLPLGSYALICRLPMVLDGRQLNLFTDVLKIPTICLWDHAPVELADQLLQPLAETPASSVPGALDVLRRALTDPLLVHFSRDSGQTRVMLDLAMARPEAVIKVENSSLRFEVAPQATPERANAAPRVGFIGHVYQDEPGWADPEVADLARRAVSCWLRDEGSPLWDVVLREIADLAPEVRQRAALDPDQSFFWRFTHRLIVHQAQTARRLHTLGSIKLPVACYGNLKPDAADVPSNLIAAKDRFRFGPELAAAFARHEITVDVMNPGFINGHSHKPVLCFVAGGFMLLDRKQDFVDTFGDVGEAVSYRNNDELGTKIDRYLANPKLRREIADEMRNRISADYALEHVLVRVLLAAWDRGGGDFAPQKPETGLGVPLLGVRDVLPDLRTQPYWSPATIDRTPDGALLTTAPRRWAYAAEIVLHHALARPVLRLDLRVLSGRLGVAELLPDMGLGDELTVGATKTPVSLLVALSTQESSKVVLRNTLEGETRVILTRAELCERIVADTNSFRRE